MSLDFSDIDSLVDYGFTGFKSIKFLRSNKSILPNKKGIYLVLNPNKSNMEFIIPGVGGFFKGKDPNVAEDMLMANYVKGTPVLYIGKAGGNNSNATLHSRINQYLKFGEGKNIGHWGGRLIWQIKHHEDLQLCWKVTPNEEPREIEKKLIGEFINHYGVIPFANLMR